MWIRAKRRKKPKKLGTERALETMIPDTASGERIWNETGETEAGISHWLLEETASDYKGTVWGDGMI